MGHEAAVLFPSAHAQVSLLGPPKQCAVGMQKMPAEQFEAGANRFRLSEKFCCVITFEAESKGWCWKTNTEDKVKNCYHSQNFRSKKTAESITSGEMENFRWESVEVCFTCLFIYLDYTAEI